MADLAAGFAGIRAFVVYQLKPSNQPTPTKKTTQ